MNRRKVLMWHLHLYGAQPIAKLIRTTGWGRQKVNSTMRALRQDGIAERSMRARYRLTDKGERIIAAERRQLKAI